MNSDQVTSTISRLLTAIGPLLVLAGFGDAQQVGTFDAAVLGVVGGAMTIGSFVYGWWQHSHSQQIAAGARSITATPDAASVAPIAQALRAQGATVNTSTLPPVAPTAL
jgi:hypothetical protein